MSVIMEIGRNFPVNSELLVPASKFVFAIVWS